MVLIKLKQNIVHLKKRDVNRTESPLRKADDAIEIDNSNLTRAEQQQILRTLFAEKTLE